jgi:hypothetical protein
MIGNAVPVEFAKRLATQIKKDLQGAKKLDKCNVKAGVVIDRTNDSAMIKNEESEALC